MKQKQQQELVRDNSPKVEGAVFHAVCYSQLGPTEFLLTLSLPGMVPSPVLARPMTKSPVIMEGDEEWGAADAKTGHCRIVGPFRGQSQKGRFMTSDEVAEEVAEESSNDFLFKKFTHLYCLAR